MRSTLIATFALALGIGSSAGCLGSSGCTGAETETVSEAEAQKLLINRNWLHRWPQTKDDRLHVFRFVPTMGGGVYHDRTLYVGFFELFTFEVERGSVWFHFPDGDERVKSRFRIQRVAGPEPFDLELTIEPSPRGPGVYYGMSRESADTWHELDALLPDRDD